MSQSHSKPILIWLCLTYILVLMMIMLGGVTRLTHSGLSIVEWKPISGIVPPLTTEQWQAEFANYQKFPEYQQVNKGMSLDAFKSIFYMEYGHRLLGRIMGLVFLIPMILFWIRGYLTPMLYKRSVIILSLGLLQGIVGWYMVKSGLVKDPSVSHYRLALHLFLALMLEGIIIWTILDVLGNKRLFLDSRPRANDKREVILKKTEKRWYKILTYYTGYVVLKTIIYGAFVAGLKAGLIYNTFPLMEGHLIPSEVFFMKPWWINFFENHAMVQFSHRILAFVSLGFVGFLWIKSGYHRLYGFWFFAVFIQLTLGVITLLYQVPVSLGAIHQGWGVIVFSVTMVVVYRTYHTQKLDKA